MTDIPGTKASNKPNDDLHAIQELTKAWLAAVQGKDLEQVLSMVTDDVIFLSASVPPIRGKDAVAALYRNMYARFDLVQTSAFEEVEVMGEWAYAWGSDSLVLIPLGGGTPIRLQGYGLTILQRQSDGSWRYRRGINSMVQIPPVAKAQE
jgi:uncharacterized protein (TIGR02246 family)